MIQIFASVYLVIIMLCAGLVFSQKLPQMRNLLVILADDHALHVTGAYGNSIIHTPHIDRLAGQGVTFTNAFCNAPICSASRQSLLTGKYPHATGVNLLFTPFPDEGNTTIAEHLAAYDYQSALIGKNHFNNWLWYPLYEKGLPQHGFDSLIEQVEYRNFLAGQKMPSLPADIECYDREKSKGSVAEWMNWRVLPQPVYDEFSEGTFYANQAIAFMRKNRDAPFLLWLAFKEPHHPFYFPIEYVGKYHPKDLPLPEGSAEDDRWIPQKFRDLTDVEKRGIIAAYYTSTEYLDKNIGLVLQALEDLDLTENTLVVYLSDNGYLLNDHKRFEKHTMWQEAIHQPLIFRLGKQFKVGKRCNALVEYIDVVPTILELLGSAALSEVQGKSFVHLFSDGNGRHRDFVFSEYLEDNLAMVTDGEWKYVFTTGSRDLGIGYQTGYGPSGIVHRLYHLPTDPQEYHDVSGLARNREILGNMQQVMLQRFMETHPDAAHCPQQLTLEGKLVWFCEPRDVGADQSLYENPVRIFKAE